MSLIKLKANIGHTIINNDFIDTYMAKPDSAVFSLIYIYALRCAMAGIDIDNKVIADKFQILESDVIRAWRYWEKEGLLALDKDSEFQIEFLVPSKSNDEPKKLKETKKEVAATMEKSVVRIERKPSYKPSDIKKVSEGNTDISQLFTMAQMMLSKTLTTNDMNTIFGLYDWLGLSLEVIAVLLTYCGKNRKSMRQVEVIAMDWAEKEIKTSEMAEDYINMYYSDYSAVLKAFGVRGRSATEAEQSFMYNWIKKYKMPMDVIKLACEKTIKNTGQVSFPYADKIIENWNTKNLRTVSAIEKSEAEYSTKAQKNKEQRQTTKAQNVAKTNKFINYEQRSYNPEELKDIERLILEKEANK